jgi:predicted NBD/HSP70 family sugar kinase
MYIGIDIGGTSIKYGLLTTSGEIVEKGKISTQMELENLLDDIEQIVTKLNQAGDVKGVGVSAPGIITSEGFMITGGAIMSLYGVDFKKELENRLKLPVQIENDANAAALAESWLGAAVGVKNYLVMTLGTGVGGGIVINGEIYRGAHGMAGEFGWMITHNLQNSGDLGDFSLNTSIAVVYGLIPLYNARVPEDKQVTEASVIFKRLENGDDVARVALDIFTTDISVGLLNLLALYDPEKILIGGGVSNEPEFSRLLQEKFDILLTRHSAMKSIKGQALGEIEMAGLKNDAGLIGAVYALKQKLGDVEIGNE